MTEKPTTAAELAFFKNVTEQTHDAIFLHCPAEGFRFVYVNEAACRHFGRRADELLRMSVSDVDPHYPVEELQKHWEELRRRKAMTVETVNRRASGEIVTVEVTTNYVVIDGAEYVAGIVRDISERKRAETALRASEERFRLLVDHATDAFVLRDERGVIVDVNRQACESLGYDREELIGMSLSKIDPDVDLARTEKRFEAGEQIVTFESSNRRKDGTAFPVEVRSRRFVSADGRQLTLTLARDTTERKRAEAALRESEARYRALIEVSPQIVWMTDADGSNVYFNQWWYDYTGLTRAESEGIGWARAAHPEQRERFVSLWQQHVATGGEWANEFLLRRGADGQYRWHLARGLPIRDADGKIVRWMGTSIDIHDRREAEEALGRSEAWLSEAQRVSHTGSWAMDPETRELKHCSPEVFRVWGFDPDGGVPRARAVLERVHPQDRARIAKELETTIRSQVGHANEMRMVLPDGTIRHIDTVIHPVFDGAGKLVEVIGTAMDITARKQAEEALRQAQAALMHVTRAATVGEVSSSLAHELNQPLFAIANNASACLGLLSSEQPDVAELRAAMSDIVSDAERASAIIARVRGMATRSAPERVPVQLSSLVREVLGLAAAESASRGVSIGTEVPDDLPLVLGDRVQLQQVLLNLVVNGMDAMSGIVESSRTLEIRGATDPREDGLFARISVRDRGVGLRAEQVERLFEPFYTTKAHGMGLGLAISRSIIEAHGGHLWAEASSDAGATFSFSLPAL